MKKLILLLILISAFSVSVAESLDDWSNEDLCRWTDAISIPDSILLEIEFRDLACLNAPEIFEVSIQEPYISEHGTVFPSPASLNRSNNHSGNGIRFIFNYKVTL